MRRTIRHAFSYSVMALGVGFALSSQALAQGSGSSLERGSGALGPVACNDITSLSVTDTTISSAAVVPAGGFEAPAPPFGGPPADYSNLPAFCRVTGSIHPSSDSDIRFELWLPAASEWNGKFMQTGNGGAAGSVVVGSLTDPLARGYAVANTDTGHQGGIGDFGWAVGHPERMIDYQYRAVHELTLVGKAITAARYGRAPGESYWLGCSTGGRQGLKEAQRYPDDYDAIVAGAPASNWSALMSMSILAQKNLGPNGLGIGKLGVLKEAAIAACDAQDGVTDRVISEPGRCGFDPASLQCASGENGQQCLTPNEVAAAKRIYAGVVDAEGDVLMPGTGIASEPAWAGYASPQFSIGTSYFRNVVARDPSWDPATFDVDRDNTRAERVDNGAAKAMDPDLSAFAARGGKLLLYHGTTDGLIPHGNTVNYYESVVDTLGSDAVDNSVKLYLVPGMDHCAGGEGAFAIDWLTALENWVDDGRAPEALPATHPAAVAGPPGAPAAPPASPRTFTRPVCVYPEIAMYKGSGDEDDAANFECAVP